MTATVATTATKAVGIATSTTAVTFADAIALFPLLPYSLHVTSLAHSTDKDQK
jgi:hypothetical protein